MRVNGWRGWGVLLASALLPLAAWGADRPQSKSPGVPGTVNYVEGQVFLNGQKLNDKSIGAATVEAGQTVSTQTGKAEVLLTPGAFFRLGGNSSAQLVSPGLTNTEVELNSGEAMLEVAEIHQGPA